MTSTDPLLQPLRIRGLNLKNRIVSTPHAPAYAEGGLPTDRYQLYHEEKAKGGLAMTMFGGSSCIGPDSPSVFGQLYVGDDRIIPHFQQFAERIHQHDCALICQISHLGRRTTWDGGNWLSVIAPSRVREPQHRGFPREMDKDDIQRVIGYFADAALRCKEGGLDGCEILHHGHLPDQFLSPRVNQRTDDYGGSFDNRFRFTQELMEAVRRAVGDDFVLGLRVGFGENGNDTQGYDDALAAAKRIELSGLIDYVTINFGHIDSDHKLAYHMPGMAVGLAPWLPVVAAIRREIDIPLIHSCRINDLATARHAIREGMLDLVGMTRAHIADPHIVNKLQRGEEDQIRPCIGAGNCLDRIYVGGEALCIHNTATGREATMPHVITKSDGPTRKVAIIGGGPAGLEAARVSAERGHSVVLFETTGTLGGQLHLAAKAGWRRDLGSLIDWYRSELERLGVDIRWNIFADEALVMAENPDVVIVASGGVPDTAYVPGSDVALSTWDVLSGAKIEGSVLVYDDNGQHQGPSCADFLADQEGVEVEFVTPDRQVAIELGTLNMPIYLEHFYKKGVRVTPDHRIQRVEQTGNQITVSFSNEYGGPEIQRRVDHLVVEHGTLPADEVFQALKERSRNRGITDFDAILANDPQPAFDDVGDGVGPALFRVGDAVSSRNLHAAIFDSLRMCKDM